MKTVLFPLILIFASINANASLIVNETKSMLLRNLSDLAFSCTPGHSDTGENFPTASSFALNNQDFLFPETNINSIGSTDNKFGVGDHCQEIKQELNAMLPLTITVTRTVEEGYTWIDGVCAKHLVERLSGTLGAIHLYADNNFNLGIVQNSNCTR